MNQPQTVTTKWDWAPDALPDPRRGRGAFLHHPAMSWSVLACSLVITGLGWGISNSYVERRTADRFESRAEEVRNRIEERLIEYEQVLRGGVGLFAASEAVSRDQWHQYVKSLRIADQWPGI